MNNDNGGGTAGGIRIDLNGNVGIKTSNPQSSLDVAGNISINGATVCTSAGCTATPSDASLKKEIKPLPATLEQLARLNPFSYEYKDQTKYVKGPQLGLIAQEVEKVFPQVVLKDEHGLRSVMYDRLVSPLIKAVQMLFEDFKQLSAKITRLRENQTADEHALKDLTTENQKLRIRVETLSRKLDSLESKLNK